MYKLLFIVLLVFNTSILHALTSVKSYTLGIFAYRPKPVMQENYQPLVDYLNSHLVSSCCQIKLKILDIKEMEAAVAASQLDFIFTNPSHYIVLRHQHKLTGAIATLVKKSNSGAATQNLAGVIFTRNTNNNIKTLADLKGQRVAIPGIKFMGGYQTQAYELLQAGIKLPDDVKIIDAGSHDNVVKIVLLGKADVGFVRTEILESMSKNGQIDLASIKVIHRQNYPQFPFISSTRLYPEWPFVALPHIDHKIISRIASALLAINDEHFEMHNAGIAGFAPAADYLPVEEVARALRLPPYDKLHNLSLKEIWLQHKIGIVVAVLLFVIISLITIVLLGRNRFILKQQQQLSVLNKDIQSFISASQVGTWKWNIQTNETIFNERWAELLGYRLEELSPVGMHTWQELTHPDDLKVSEQRVKLNIEGKTELYEIDIRMKHKDGHWVWINDRGMVTQWQEDGSPLWMSGTHTDISERVKREKQLQESHAKYQKLVDDIGDKFVIFSHEGLSGKLTYVSNVSKNMFGIRAVDTIGQSWAELINWLPESLALGQSTVIQHIDGLLDFSQIELSFIHPDGSQRTIQSSTHPVRDKSGTCIAIEGIAEDITERKLIQEQTRLAASVFTYSQEGILITNTNNVIVDVNPACLDVTGYTREEVIGKKPSLFSSGSQPPEFYKEMWQTLINTGRWQGEIWNRKKSGQVYSERLSIDRVLDERGQLQNYVAIFYDITYLKEHEANLEHIAHHDPLTGLPNRLLLRDRLQQAVYKAKRNEKLLAVAFLDLDGFKPINDSYGHKAGDYVLIEVAKRLKNSVREGDTVARIGGDEFVLLMLDLETIDELKQVLERILLSIANTYILPDETVIEKSDMISASIGITLYPQDNSEADMLLRHADQAMYKAKLDGKNRYNFYDADE